MEDFRGPNKPIAVFTAPPVGSTLSEFRDCIMAAHQLYMAHKIRPNAQAMMQFGLVCFEQKKIELILNSAEFAIAMQRKGIPWNEIDKLSARQLACLNAVCNPLKKGSLSYRLRQAGVSETEFKTWRQNPHFEAQYKSLMRNVLTEWTEAIDTAIVQGALDGRLENAKYINELTGRHDPNRLKALEVEKVLMQVIEIVQRRLSELDVPASTLAAIGTELLGVLESNPKKNKELA